MMPLEWDPRLPYSLCLRAVQSTDLDALFQFQKEPDAVHMAAFTNKDPTDRAAFDMKWDKILADPSVTMRTILVDEAVAGSIGVHGWFGEPEVTYWIGQRHWGRGVASRALECFLQEYTERPLHARVAADNPGSIRVLEKCGFRRQGRERAFAVARQQEIEEFLFRLS